ncbi:MAG: FAD-binding oxidoreductase [Desulfobacterota bacterium]|nr:FAD-binding oxidoreductase [Thermodesulfobacteriota bacterium]
MVRMGGLLPQLKAIVGEANLIDDPDRLQTYGVDGKRPKAVALPGSQEEVSKLLALANDHGLAVIPMGSGTKREIGALPKRLDLVVSTLRLNRITDCDCDNLTLSAEGGLTLGEVQKRLAREGRGYFLPLDPPFSEKATLGGIVASNASGPGRLLYGTARDLVIGAKAVLPNGDLVATGGKTVKNVSGYDLCKLLIGSYGTLGILCEITFKLLPLPEKAATLVLPYPGLEGAVAFSQEILRSQYLPSSMEILNPSAVERLNLEVSSKGYYLLAIRLEGVVEAVERQLSEMGEKGRQKGAISQDVLQGEAHEAFWEAIRNFPERMRGEGGKGIRLKSSFLISRCGEVMAQYERIGQDHRLNCALLCHSGNGILYTSVFPDGGRRVSKKAVLDAIGAFSSVASQYEGHLVVERCPSSWKGEIEVWGPPRSDYGIMRRLKEEFDPKGILNPGRFIDGL